MTNCDKQILGCSVPRLIWSRDLQPPATDEFQLGIYTTGSHPPSSSVLCDRALGGARWRLTIVRSLVLIVHQGSLLSGHDSY
ncbi:hypothetical protein M378DRAFT_170249 [Amanita muscaria Koide BX008]|uniref:Uncharacterized protein n=1 Tax=Amanita muscaria (strain Koide BX008) TaxID=946122 RepID=A0A0C2WBM9_AMAMK|nr:hypothetical protein M378DRAFT_170249 [Amanita muscaria Koide BX008]